MKRRKYVNFFKKCFRRKSFHLSVQLVNNIDFNTVKLLTLSSNNITKNNSNRLYYFKNLNFINFNKNINNYRININILDSISSKSLYNYILTHCFERLKDNKYIPDFRGTFEFILSVNMNKYYKNFSSSLYTNFTVIQMQKLRNKRIQLNFFVRQYTFNTAIYSLKLYSNINFITCFGFFNFTSFRFYIKSRAGNME